MDFDLIVIGAGPAGLCLARALRGSGLRLCLVEQQPLAAVQNPAFDGREIALTQHSAQRLRELGLWPLLGEANIAPLRDALVLDGGACPVGIESTIIDCTRGAPVLLRPGQISREQVQAACGLILLSKEELAAPSPRASGTLESHYAPHAKVRLMDARALQAALDVLDVLGPELAGGPATIAVYARAVLRLPANQVLYRRMPDDADATAQQLFAVLRDFDAQGVKLIWIEPPPDTPAWEGVRDRLTRAAA